MFDLVEVTDEVAEVDEPAAGLAAAGLAAASDALLANIAATPPGGAARFFDS